MKINNKIYIFSRCLVSGLALCTATLANAALVPPVSSVVSTGSNGGHAVSSGGVTEITGGATARVTVGTSIGNTFSHGVFAFQLPDLGAYSFVSADLTWTGTKEGTPPAMHLYALRTSSAASVSVTTADFSASPSADKLLLSNIIQSGSTGLTNANLNTWLNANYSAGDYVYFLFQAQTQPTKASQRRLIDNTIILAINDSNAVPEPSTYALIFGGLTLGFVMIRRHRKA